MSLLSCISVIKQFSILFKLIRTILLVEVLAGDVLNADWLSNDLELTRGFHLCQQEHITQQNCPHLKDKDIN